MSAPAAIIAMLSTDNRYKMIIIIHVYKNPFLLQIVSLNIIAVAIEALVVHAC